jgi:DNA-binding MarR family transcriptional regulator
MDKTLEVNEAEPLDETDRQILQQIWSAEPGYATNSMDIGAFAGDIARAAQKDEDDVARRLRSLEARGLVRREPGQFEGSFRIALTEKAKDLLK